MDEMLLCDKLEELWYRISNLHLGYINSGEKKDSRKRLDGYIEDYLSLAPHGRKFHFPQTAQVLRRSAGNSEKFSGNRASEAWAAIAEYANNLLSQPWRKEFRQIKLYCGFYKHKVESSLVGAELMFEAMGYKHTADSSLTLNGVLDPDQIMEISKDAILAQMECNIMQQIWDAMSRHVTWAQILEFRENHPGTAEQAIRALKYRVHERQYQDNLSRRPRNCSVTGYYDSHRLHHTHHAYPVPRYAHVVSPQQIVPPPMMYQHQVPYAPPPPVLKPQELYPMNGYQMHYPANVPHYVPNGYAHAHPQCAPSYPHVPTVPTGQLIELETSPVHPPRVPVQMQYPYHVPETVCDAGFLSSKAKDDGAGSWENWDYVYRSLETRKDNADKELAEQNAVDGDLSDRFRNLNANAKGKSPQQPRAAENRTRTEGDGEARRRQSRNSGDLEETLQKHKLSKIDNDETFKKKTLADFDMVDAVARPIESAPVAATTKVKTLIQKNEKESNLPPPIPDKAESLVQGLHNNRDTSDFVRDISPVVDLPPKEGSWSCVTCTYLNNPQSSVCEMCNKSRNRGEIKPQPCGGQQCPSCTLVNPRGKNFCEACQESLKGSPIYI